MFDFDVDVEKGDVVLFSAHPGAGISYPAHVLAKGNDSIEVVVYAWNGATASASHKTGVRHSSNEIFRDPIRLSNLMEDGDSGCFELHPTKILLKQFAERIAELELRVFKGKAPKPKTEVKEESAPDLKPDLSFRMDDNGPSLTDEQKAERKAILEAVR